jgi:hypothetical protein
VLGSAPENPVIVTQSGSDSNSWTQVFDGVATATSGAATVVNPGGVGDLAARSLADADAVGASRVTQSISVSVAATPEGDGFEQELEHFSRSNFDEEDDSEIASATSVTHR